MMKVKQTLGFLGLDPKAADKKRQYFTGRNSFHNNKAYVHALIDSGFIPYPAAPPEVMINFVDNKHNIFEPDLLGELDTITKDSFQTAPTLWLTTQIMHLSYAF